MVRKGKQRHSGFPLADQKVGPICQNQPDPSMNPQGGTRCAAHCTVPALARGSLLGKGSLFIRLVLAETLEHGAVRVSISGVWL